MMVSVIIPVYNEERTIIDCLSSLVVQEYPLFEIVIVDDGSDDNSRLRIREFLFRRRREFKNFRFFYQEHQGPAAARNLGARKARGKVFVFVDADMTFAKDFVKNLVKPIEKGKTIGTFSKEEYLLNKDNIWAICWNINRYLINGWRLDKEVYERILPTYYSNQQPVFRAILAKEFNKVRGFDDIGYTDDWTLSRKLGIQAKAAPGAIFYHRNPESLWEVFRQARWIGKNEFLTGNFPRRILNLIRYSPPISFLKGTTIAVFLGKPEFLLFKLVYDWGVWLSVFEKSFSRYF